MDKYFNLYREMISLRGLSDHTLNSYFREGLFATHKVCHSSI